MNGLWRVFPSLRFVGLGLGLGAFALLGACGAPATEQAQSTSAGVTEGEALVAGEICGAGSGTYGPGGETVMQATSTVGLSMAIVRDDRVIWEGGCGFIGDEPRRAGTRTAADTVWLAASVSKISQTVAVLKLLEERAAADAGEGATDEARARALNALLDADVSSLVGTDPQVRKRQCKNGNACGAVTMRMILTHTAGIRNNYDCVPHNVAVSPGQYDDKSPTELREAYRRLFSGQANCTEEGLFMGDAQPGRFYSYSSTSNAIAALASRQLRDVAFDEWSRTSVFAPLGMQDTAWRLRDLASAGRLTDEKLALPLTPTPEGATNATSWATPSSNCGAGCKFWEATFYPAASLKSTARDHARLVTALMNDGSFGGSEILRPETVLEMLDSQLRGGASPTGFNKIATYIGQPPDWFSDEQKREIGTGHQEGQGLTVYASSFGDGDDRKMFGHGGYNPGFSSAVYWQPKRAPRADRPALYPYDAQAIAGVAGKNGERHRYGVVVFTNSDAGGGVDGFVRLVLDKAARGLFDDAFPSE